jgi:glycosyltransferase involved in cell wall biosynthesis
VYIDWKPVATFDIIIPAYNAARYLPAAIESVISQTFGDWRIILVNDGSTDSTAAIADEYQRKLGDRMLVVTQANAGLPAARNVAIRNSSAEFLAILDADDIWLPCRLAESLKSFESRPEVGLSYGLITVIDQDGNPQRTFAGNRSNAEGKIARSIYQRKVDLPCPTITFRRKCIEEVGLFDETMRSTEDRDMWLRIAFRREVAFIPKVIAFYRIAAGGMSGNMDRMFDAQRQFIRKHYGAPGCGLVARQIALSHIYKQRADGQRQRQARGAAFLCSLQACAIWPFSTDNLRTAASLAGYFISGRQRT